jgi:putative sigma-54 modulation protein
MLVTVRAQHVDITSALKEYAESKVEKLSKRFENIQEIVVELDVSETSDEGKRNIAKGIIKASQTLIRAEQASDNMYASIDLLEDKLEVQLRRHKEKMKDHKNNDKLAHKIEVHSRDKHHGSSQDVLNDIERRYVPKPMVPEEAADYLRLEKLSFLMFRNSTTEEINVIYEMKNKDYGLIEP